MTYETRFDKRGFDELRPMIAKVGIIPRADGSALFQTGKTTAYAAVYGPRDLHPKFLQNPQTGILRCDYDMMPFSGHGERVRPGGSRRSREISMLMSSALMPVLDLKGFPNTVVDIFVELPQTDAGTRCAAITAASMALADAGLEMKDMVGAVSIGFYDGKLLADINGEEDCDLNATDIPVAYIPALDKISLLQLDGEIDRENLIKALELAKKKILEICELQKKALKEKYAVPG